MTIPTAPGRTELFDAHQSYALTVANSHARTLPRHVQLAEVQSAALEGLWDATRRWDRTRPFRTYAAWRIRGAIQDYLRSCLPVGARRAQVRQTAVHVPGTVSLSANRSVDGDEAKDYDPPTLAAPPRLDLADELHRVLSPLPLRTRLILRLYYCEGLRMADVGAVFGVTESSVSYIVSGALTELRAHWERQRTLFGSNRKQPHG